MVVPADPDAFTPFVGLNHVDLELHGLYRYFQIYLILYSHHIISLITYPTKNLQKKMTMLMDKSIKDIYDNNADKILLIKLINYLIFM